jgi:hypothetical protein
MSHTKTAAPLPPSMMSVVGKDIGRRAAIGGAGGAALGAAGGALNAEEGSRLQGAFQGGVAGGTAGAALGAGSGLLHNSPQLVEGLVPASKGLKGQARKDAISQAMNMRSGAQGLQDIAGMATSTPGLAMTGVGTMGLGAMAAPGSKQAAATTTKHALNMMDVVGVPMATGVGALSGAIPGAIGGALGADEGHRWEGAGHGALRGAVLGGALGGGGRVLNALGGGTSAAMAEDALIRKLDNIPGMGGLRGVVGDASARAAADLAARSPLQRGLLTAGDLVGGAIPTYGGAGAIGYLGAGGESAAPGSKQAAARVPAPQVADMGFTAALQNALGPKDELSTLLKAYGINTGLGALAGTGAGAVAAGPDHRAEGALYGGLSGAVGGAAHAPLLAHLGGSTHDVQPWLSPIMGTFMGQRWGERAKDTTDKQAAALNKTAAYTAGARTALKRLALG